MASRGSDLCPCCPCLSPRRRGNLLAEGQSCDTDGDAQGAPVLEPLCLARVVASTPDLRTRHEPQVTHRPGSWRGGLGRESLAGLSSGSNP